MVQYKANWYAIVLPSTPSDYDHYSHHCQRLGQYQREIRYSPMLNGWEELIRENELDEVKVTCFSVNRKQWIYLRLGE
jgi:hypothetical protein